MRCTTSEGWESRILAKTGFSAGGGLLGGWVYAVLQSGPAQRWALATSASCAICVGTFAALQELARRLRCSDGPVNSFVAGGTAAYVLSNIQFKNQQKAVAIALVSAGGAALIDASISTIDLSARLKDTLVGLDLLDCTEAVPKPAEKRELTADELEEPWESMAYYHTGTWKDYLPIRKLSEEEWELYQRKKAQRFQERIDKITKPPPGGVT